MTQQTRPSRTRIRSHRIKPDKLLKSPGRIALSWVEAFNAVNVDRLLLLYAEYAVLELPSEEPAEGREAIRSTMAKCLASHLRKPDGDRSCITDNVLEDGDWGVLRWRDALGFTGCHLFRCDDGLIAHQYGFWDTRGLQVLYETHLP